MMRLSLRARPCLMLVLCTAPALQAEVICVASPGAIATALDTAETNGEADDIRVVEGHYAIASTLSLSIHEAFAVTLSGRWSPGCATQTGASTTLDGQDATRILYAFSDALSDLAITDLVFTGGRNTAATAGGALSIETSGRNVLIERNLFLSNADLGSAGATRIAISTSDSVLTLRNNVVVGNTAPEGGGIVVNAGIGQAYVTGNTVVANTATIAGALCGGVCIAGGSDFTLNNNILWNNSGGDLHIGNTGTALLLHNDIDAMNGQPPAAGSTGNLDVDPGFAQELPSVRLAADSPLIDAGIVAAPGGIGPLDYARALRVQGQGVDIGALESDILFRNGFDP